MKKSEYIIGIAVLGLGAFWFLTRKPAMLVPAPGAPAGMITNPVYTGPPLGTSGNSTLGQIGNLINSVSGLAATADSIYQDNWG